MTLSQMFDQLDTLIMDKRPVSEIKPVFITLRDQVEALHRDHAALKTSHAALVNEKSNIETELAEVKAAYAKLKNQRQSGYGMSDIGGML